MNQHIVSFACVIALTATLVTSAQPSSKPLSNSLPAVVVVISDLHLGPGERTIGSYYPQEDFRWGEDFVSFLDALHRAGGGKVTLVIAGDMFELWETESKSDCQADANFGCTEEEARARMVPIVGAHRVELQALGAFASRGSGNRVIIIPGNHDAALMYPGVWELVKVAARPAKPDHFEIATSGRWISPAGNIVVEHGHQIDEANRFSGWPNLVATAPSGANRLRSPFGEVLVRQFFDPIEHEFPVVDNITGGAGLLYGIKRKGITGTAAVLTDFVKLLTLDVSFRQFTSFLGGDTVTPPVWDVATERLTGLQFLLNGFPPGDPAGTLAREILVPTNPAIVTAAAATVQAMTDDEIRTICQSRFVAAKLQEKEGVPAAQRQAPCVQTPGGDLSYLKDKVVQSVMGSTYYINQHVDNVIAQLPSVKANATGNAVYVYGHTHAASRANAREGSPFKIINTGAWQRLIRAETLAARAKASNWSSDQVLQQLKLDDLPACYSFVWLPSELNKPLEPKLRYWMFDGDNWKFTKECSERELLPSE